MFSMMKTFLQFFYPIKPIFFNYPLIIQHKNAKPLNQS